MEDEERFVMKKKGIYRPDKQAGKGLCECAAPQCGQAFDRGSRIPTQEGRREMNIARIKFNGMDFMLPRAEHTGENLRAFFGVKPSHDLFVECDNDDVVVPDDSTPFFVDTGDRFYSAHRKINNG